MINETRGLPRFTSAPAIFTVACFSDLFGPDHSVDQNTRCFANFWAKDATLAGRRETGTGLHLAVRGIV
jgi:hypothetical protein